MLDAARHHQALARTELDHMVAEFDAEIASPYQEELVLAVVMVPRKRARDLDELDLLAIERRDDLGAPMLGEARELFVQTEFFGHGTTTLPPRSGRVPGSGPGQAPRETCPRESGGPESMNTVLYVTRKFVFMGPGSRSPRSLGRDDQPYNTN